MTSEREHMQACLARAVANMSDLDRKNFFASYAKGRTPEQIETLKAQAREEWRKMNSKRGAA